MPPQVQCYEAGLNYVIFLALFKKTSSNIIFTNMGWVITSYHRTPNLDCTFFFISFLLAWVLLDHQINHCLTKKERRNVFTKYFINCGCTFCPQKMWQFARSFFFLCHHCWTNRKRDRVVIRALMFWLFFSLFSVVAYCVCFGQNLQHNGENVSFRKLVR